MVCLTCLLLGRGVLSLPTPLSSTYDDPHEWQEIQDHDSGYFCGNQMIACGLLSRGALVFDWKTNFSSEEANLIPLEAPGAGFF